MNIGNFLQAQKRPEGQAGRADGAPDPAGQGFAKVFGGLTGADAAAAAVQAIHMPVAAEVSAEGAVAGAGESDEAVLADVMKLVDADAGESGDAAEGDILPSTFTSDASAVGVSAAESELSMSQNQDSSSSRPEIAAGLETAQAHADDHAQTALQAAQANIQARTEARASAETASQSPSDVDAIDLAGAEASPAVVTGAADPSVDPDAAVNSQNPSDAANVIVAAASVPLALDPETKAKTSAPHPNAMNSEVRGSFTAQAGTPAAVLAQAEWARQQAMESAPGGGGGDFASLIDGPDAGGAVSTAASPFAINAPGAVLRGLDSPLAPTVSTNMNTPVPAHQLTQHAVAIIREIGDGRSEATIELHPAELGQLDLDMRQDGQRLEISVTVDNEQSRRLVQDQFAQWRDRLADSGLQLQRLDVEVRDQSSNARQNSDMPNGVANRGSSDDVKNPTRVVIRDPSRALDAYA